MLATPSLVISNDALALGHEGENATSMRRSAPLGLLVIMRLQKRTRG